jgi:NAD(P)-dependent dehydrogenase (short-subunit alcohol dehydrogenase family)
MAAREFSLNDKAAVVTGAGRGIGRGIALALAEAGADVAVVARTAKEIDQVAEEIRQLDRKSISYPTDVTDSNAVDETIEKVLADFGKIDILVNNAGMGLHKPILSPNPAKDAGREDGRIDSFDRMSDEEWNRVVNLNLTSAFFCARAVGRHMILQRKGKIINISSYAGAKGRANNISYSATKAALNMSTRSLALEWARYNINVNGIGPGYIHTDLTARLFEDAKLKERLLKVIPLKRPGTPREIGLLAVYLASDAADYITGPTIFIDGGMLA